MKLADLANGAPVFVDANILVHHFAADPTQGPACRAFIERVERQELTASTSSHVISDVAHRLMTIEAINRLGWPVAGVGRRLKRQPPSVQGLTNYLAALRAIQLSQLNVFPVSLLDGVHAGDACHQHGLLSGDGLIVALMHTHGLTNLASTDTDFDRVPGITRYEPA